MVIALGDWDLGDRRLYGDLLALGGAVAVAGYYIAGRSLREQLSILGYIAPVYGTAAVLLAAAALATGAQLTGFDVEVYGWLVLLALLPQVVGHSTLNWSLGYLPATLVATAVMAEPVGASLLAWAVLDEAPPVTSVAGGALVLVGVFTTLAGGPTRLKGKAIGMLRITVGPFLAAAAPFPGSSVVERSAVNRLVVGSSPTRGATLNTTLGEFAYYSHICSHRLDEARVRPSPAQLTKDCDSSCQYGMLPNEVCPIVRVQFSGPQ